MKTPAPKRRRSLLTAGAFGTDIPVGRTFDMDGVVPRLGADVPRRYGETIGFRDGNVLVTWSLSPKQQEPHDGNDDNGRHRSARF